MSLTEWEEGREFPPKGTFIEVVEVGSRDGFQIERDFIPTDRKIEIINGLIDSGVRYLEVTSFVSPRAVPQLADAAEVMAGIDRSKGAYLTTLVPNLKGAERAAASRADAIVIVCSASETHNAKNVNRSVAGSLAGFGEIIRFAHDAGMDVVGGIGTSFGCPFEGDIDPQAVLDLAKAYADLGARQVTLGDTTGMATPPTVRRVVRLIRQELPDLGIRLHFHNTRGIGLANVLVGLAEGVTLFDSSVAGLGGCPFAAGATGNICTEDLVYLLHESGYETGIDIEKLVKVARRTQQVIGRELSGQVMKSGQRLQLYDAGAVSTAAG
ncbi:hydroxymethylglutaryl-CoA lyase [Bosea sp. (in: a-proteobacteria)]|uniref:hydroxymethylglutaryl-CoA lyase n=1 Tax=Bosea sp. (in: a-proteobacteria) TaxID=1871050 RepID=UPI002606D28C|nr:hydroxymethylglutaryl-CoA lyase [Bosea sp. (in: a-proteobacteria)]MCO5090214.1 hydroxymethylglutaryl-CoA lyase [Bosea sp. (in: a-proteobacteria)]